MAITQDDVDVACEAIAASGERPTVDRVREHLRGSPNTLTPLVRTWKARQQMAAAPQTQAAGGEPPVLPLPIQRAIDGIVGALNSLPLGFAAAVAEVAETERRRSRLEIEAIMADAKAQLEAALATAEDERLACDSVRGEVDQKDAAIAALEAELSQATSALEAQRAAAMAAEAQAKRLTDENAALQTTVRETQAAAAVARAATEAAQAAGADLRTSLAVAQNSVQAERQRAERSEADVERLRAERDRTESLTIEAVERAARAEARLAALTDAVPVEAEAQPPPPTGAGIQGQAA